MASKNTKIAEALARAQAEKSAKGQDIKVNVYKLSSENEQTFVDSVNRNSAEVKKQALEGTFTYLDVVYPVVGTFFGKIAYSITIKME